MDTAKVYLIVGVCFLQILVGTNATTFFRNLDGNLPYSGKNCTKSGILCDCDFVNDFFFCFDMGNGNFEKQKLGSCPRDQTCIQAEGGCSDKPNMECNIVPPFRMQCTSDGMFPDPYNCKKYHICVLDNSNPLKEVTTSSSVEARVPDDAVVKKNFLAYESECDKGFGYDPLSTYCKIPLENNQCSSPLISVCKEATMPKVFSANPSLFYMCIQNDNDNGFSPKLFKCLHGESFIDNKCVSSEDTTSSATTEVTSATTNITPKWDCGDLPNRAKFPDFSDCRYYYRCENSEAVRLFCGNGRSFNKRRLTCDKGYLNC